MVRLTSATHHRWNPRRRKFEKGARIREQLFEEYEWCIYEWVRRLSDGDPDARIIAEAVGKKCDFKFYQQDELHRKIRGESPMDSYADATKAATEAALIAVLEHRAKQKNSSKPQE